MIVIHFRTAPRSTARVSVTAVASLALAVALGLVLGACFGRNGGPAPPQVVPAAAAEDRIQSLPPAERQVVEIFKDASRSVVFISNNAVVRRGFFSRNVQEVPQGTGSGFVWDKEGHIVTNYHVVRGAASLTVTLQDQSIHRAKRVGVFADRELAVLKIDAPPEKLFPIRVGRSSDLLVGMTTLAIGNPFGLDHTLTVGVISALDREIQSLTGRRIADVIQTDAAINPGNSGGPLLNSSGELIGMNTAILSPSGVSAGIGFAVPVDIVRRYVDQIIKNGGKIQGAGLGVGLVPDNWTRLHGIRGVLVEYVAPRSAAAKAGLRGTTVLQDGEVDQLGDIIVTVGERGVSDINSLRDALEHYAVGDEVDVTYEREGARKKTKVTLQQIELQGEDE